MSGQIEVQKVACRQDKAGWLVTIRIHPDDHDHALILSAPGDIFNLSFTETEEHPFCEPKEGE